MSEPPFPPPPPGWQPPSPPPGWQSPQPPFGSPQPGYPPQWQQPYGWAPTHAARFGLQPAGFGERLAAILLDGIATTLLLAPAIVVGVVMVAANWETEQDICRDIDTGERYVCEQPVPATVAWIFGALGLVVLASLLIGVFYWGKLEGQRTQTWGKKVMGIRTVRASTGMPLGFGRAVGRFFARYVSGQVCYLGYLWMLWDNDKQTWHDKIVDSIVVKA